MPYWRLSSFYLFYFAALGALVPFWTLYLNTLGFNAVEIGQLMAIPTATKIIAPYIWGWLGDHIGRRMAIVRAGSFLAFLTFLLVFWLSGYSGIALAMSLFSFFWNAVLPQVDPLDLLADDEAEGDRPDDEGQDQEQDQQHGGTIPRRR